MIGRLFAFSCRSVFLLACGVFAGGMVLIGIQFPFVPLAAAGVAAWGRLRRAYGSNWSHGSATIAGLPEIERAGLLAGDGLILGRCLPERPSRWAAVLGLLSPRVGSEAACRMFLAAFFGTKWYADRMIRINQFVPMLTCSP
jgi:hypothetical protein